MSDYIKIEKREHIYILTMNRPEKLNAISSDNIAELEAKIEELNADHDCKVLIITGAGRAFSAGADVNNKIGNLSPMEKTVKFSRAFKELYKAIEFARPYTIAAINGFALGGGLEMALACDTRVAARCAKVGLVEPAIGSFPGGAGLLRLPRIIGLGKAKEFFALAERMPAEAAAQYGVIDHIVSDDELIDYCVALGERIAKNSTTAIAMGKRIMTMGYEMDIDRASELETAWLGYYAESHDRLEGRAALKEKRKPNFE